jgi:hypothetical protein
MILKMNTREFILEILFHIFFMVLGLSIIYFTIISPLSERLIRKQLEYSFGTFQGDSIFNIPVVLENLQELINYLNSITYTNNPAADPTSSMIQNPVTNTIIITCVACGVSMLAVIAFVLKTRAPFLVPLLSSFVIVLGCLITDVLIIYFLVSNIQYVDIGSLFNYLIQNPDIKCTPNYTTIMDKVKWKYINISNELPKLA